MARNDIDWTEERKLALRALWLQDDPVLPSAEIARRLGISKNAVVGKARRLRLPARPSPIIPKDGAPPRKAAPSAGAAETRMAALRAAAAKVALAAAQRRMPAAPQPPPAPPAARPTAGTVTPRTCRWPLWGHGEVPTHRYCGAPATDMRPYCEAHCRIAYTAGRVPAGTDLGRGHYARVRADEEPAALTGELGVA